MSTEAYSLSQQWHGTASPDGAVACSLVVLPVRTHVVLPASDMYV